MERLIKREISGLIKTVAIMPIGVIVPKNARVKGMVKICAAREAESERAIGSGKKRIHFEKKKRENRAIPKSAEYESKKERLMPSSGAMRICSINEIDKTDVRFISREAKEERSPIIAQI